MVCQAFTNTEAGLVKVVYLVAARSHGWLRKVKKLIVLVCNKKCGLAESSLGRERVTGMNRMPLWAGEFSHSLCQERKFSKLKPIWKESYHPLIQLLEKDNMMTESDKYWPCLADIFSKKADFRPLRSSHISTLNNCPLIDASRYDGCRSAPPWLDSLGTCSLWVLLLLLRGALLLLLLLLLSWLLRVESACGAWTYMYLWPASTSSGTTASTFHTWSWWIRMAATLWDDWGLGDAGSRRLSLRSSTEAHFLMGELIVH